MLSICSDISWKKKLGSRSIRGVYICIHGQDGSENG